MHGEASEARLLLLQAELDATEKPTDRIALYKGAIDSLKKYEEWAKGMVRSGQATETAVLKIQARRLEVEIRLERAKHPQERATPARKGQADESVKKVKELRKERIAVLKKQLDQLTKLFRDARGSYDEVLEANRLLCEAELEVAETDTERVELSKKLVAALQESELTAKARWRAGRVTQASVFKAMARRLEAEIRLEQAKMKAPEPVAKPGVAQPLPPNMTPPRPPK